jgi:hypothetical protein
VTRLLPILLLTGLSCVGPSSSTTSTSRPANGAAPGASPGINTLQSLHLRLTLNPQTGDVTYFGWYDGRRNLLGSNGITTAIVGAEPPELTGELQRVSDHELVFRGIDQNRIVWVKRYQLIGDDSVQVTHRITSRRDEPFPAIIYSLADLPDATITGDNRDQRIRTPAANARFHAEIENPHFPGEQMNPYALRSDSRTLEPGDSMEFKMTWQLEPARAQ